MPLHTLLRTDLKVSRACLGTMTFGMQTDEATAARMVDLCLDRGINFVDTANVYNLGKAETILGTLLQGRRNRVVLASKVCMKMGDGPDQSGLSKAAIHRSIDESLRRLRTDHLDLYYLHKPDNATHIAETLDALDGLIKAGKVRYAGVSNFPAWRVCQILWLCDKSGYQPPVVAQPAYNLIARGIEAEYVPACRALQLSIAVYNPLAGGLLTDLAAGTRPPRTKRYARPAYAEAVEELRGAAARAGRSLVDLALSWLLHHSAADCAILGAQSLEQLHNNLDVLDHGPLPDATVAECDAVWQRLSDAVPTESR